MDSLTNLIHAFTQYIWLLGLPDWASIVLIAATPVALAIGIIELLTTLAQIALWIVTQILYLTIWLSKELFKLVKKFISMLLGFVTSTTFVFVAGAIGAIYLVESSSGYQLMAEVTAAIHSVFG